ncbi:unnamed protein product [Larinioides sclopetarius]
MFTFTKE